MGSRTLITKLLQIVSGLPTCFRLPGGAKDTAAAASGGAASAGSNPYCLMRSNAIGGGLNIPASRLSTLVTSVSSIRVSSP
jgi:hypothetical protein